MKNMKIAWCCLRHEITEEQVEEAKKILGIGDGDGLVVVHDASPWAETSDQYSDYCANTEHWLGLLGGEYDAVFGIFPNSAFWTMMKFEHSRVNVFVPISKKTVAYKNGKASGRMQFVRWQKIKD